jgi:hypothetical protein
MDSAMYDSVAGDSNKLTKIIWKESGVENRMNFVQVDKYSSGMDRIIC